MSPLRKDKNKKNDAMTSLVNNLETKAVIELRFEGITLELNRKKYEKVVKNSLMGKETDNIMSLYAA